MGKTSAKTMCICCWNVASAILERTVWDDDRRNFRSARDFGVLAGRRSVTGQDL